MKISTRLTGLLTAVTLLASPLAMAEMNRTQGTIVGAAVGGVAGSVIGSNMESTLIGAAAGGLLGNLLTKNNANYEREGRYNNRYYYGGREFKNRKDYDAYREAVNRNMLRDKEARRYASYREDRRNHAKKRDNRNVRQVAVKRDQREWNNRRNDHRAEFRGNGNGHRKHHHR